MDTQESNTLPNGVHASYRMSWVAYVRPVLVLLITLGIGTALFKASIWLGIIGCAAAISLFVFNVLSIRSVRLYTDDLGVWVYRGILPWNRGMAGVKWRDLEDAVYFTNFFSWLFKSYTVRVGHRFTKTSEIILVHIRHGNLATEHINQLHHRILAGERTNLN